MDRLALMMALASAGMHAAWNYQAKRSDDSLSFLWSLAIASPIVAGAALVIQWLTIDIAPDFSAWPIALAGGVVQAAYFSFMGAGYDRGELSTVYPLSRGVAPIIIAFAGWLWLAQSASVAGTVGIVVILVGIMVLLRSALTRPTVAVSRGSILFGLLAAVAIAAYHLIDQAGARASSVVSYQFLLESFLASALVPIIIIKRRTAAVGTLLRTNGLKVLGAAAIAYVAYALVIAAMVRESAAYVAAARNVSIIIGIAMGTMGLAEGAVKTKLVAGALVVGGLAIMAIGG
jgi:drug/metabolite transporter (DMT)-like permease